jgi:hypothetical protein
VEVLAVVQAAVVVLEEEEEEAEEVNFVKSYILLF